MLRLKVKVISMSGRSTRGFKVMDLTKDSIVASVARMAAKDIERVEPTKKIEMVFEQQPVNQDEAIEEEIEEIDDSGTDENEADE
jgi:hypothetical protein